VVASGVLAGVVVSNVCTFPSLSVPGTVMLTATVNYTAVDSGPNDTGTVQLRLGRTGSTNLDTQTVGLGANAASTGVATLTAVDSLAGARTYAVSRASGAETINACRLVYLAF
jgi:hypothetical protein